MTCSWLLEIKYVAIFIALDHYSLISMMAIMWAQN